MKQERINISNLKDIIAEKVSIGSILKKI
jgi:hypothetical protein